VGTPLGDSARYVTAILSFVAGALLGGRLLRGPQKLRERRIGFAVEWVDWPVHDERRHRRCPDTIRHRLAVAADEHRLQSGNDPAAFRRSSVELGRLGRWGSVQIGSFGGRWPPI
jgi:hypothetical protein